MIQASSAQGFTLIELLIALGLGLGVVAAAIQTVSLAQRSQLAARAWVDIRETGLIASRAIGRAVADSRTQGCTGLAPVNGLDPTAGGFDSRLADVAVQVLPGSPPHPRQDRGDRLVLQQRRVTREPVEIIGTMANPPYPDTLLLAKPVSDPEVGDLVLLTALDQGLCLLFQLGPDAERDRLVRGGGGLNPGNAPLADSPQPGLRGPAQLARIERQSFFVSASAATPGSSSLYTSWRSDGDRAVELVEGVEDFRVFYGVTAGSDGSLQFLPGNDPALAARPPTAVKALRLRLLLHSNGPWPGPDTGPEPEGLPGGGDGPARLRQALSLHLPLRRRRRPTGRPGRSQGAALVSVILLLALLSLISVEAAREALTQVRSLAQMNQRLALEGDAATLLHALEAALSQTQAPPWLPAIAAVPAGGVDNRDWPDMLDRDGSPIDPAVLGLDASLGIRVLIERLADPPPLDLAMPMPAGRLRITVEVIRSGAGVATAVVRQQSVYRP